MFIKYHWENVECNVLDNDDNALEPRTHKETKDIDYDYDRDVTVDDLVEYLLPIDIKKQPHRAEEKGWGKIYLTKAFEFMLEHGIEINGGDLEDELERDEYFVEYMHDKYEEEAFEEWEEYYNEEY